MTWIKLDVDVFGHPKVVAAGSDAALLYIAGLCYSGRHLTNGHIPKAAVRIVAAEAGVKPSLQRNLVDNELWHDRGDNYEIHDYLEHQRSRDSVNELSAKRAEAGRRGAEAKHGKPGGKPPGNTNGKPPGKLPSKSPGKSVAEVEGELDPPRFQTPPADRVDSLDEDLERTCALIAGRKLAARTDRGEPPPDNAASWLTKVTANDRDRLQARHAGLRSEHPDWTLERLADELDPETAARDHRIADADESLEHLAKLDADRAAAVPMPPKTRKIRDEIGRKKAAS